MAVEFPLPNWLEAHSRQSALQDAILHMLERRFTDVPAELVERIRSVHDEARLLEVLDAIADCSDIDSFQQQLPTDAESA